MEVYMKKLFTILAVSSSLIYGQSGWAVYGGWNSNGMTAEGLDASYTNSKSFNVGISKQLGEKVTIGTGLHHRGGYINTNVAEKVEGHVFELWSTWSLLSMENGASLWAGPSIAFKADLDYKLGGADKTGDVKMEDTDLSLLLGASFPLSERNTIHLVFQQSLRDVNLSYGNSDWYTVEFDQIYLNFSRSL